MTVILFWLSLIARCNKVTHTHTSLEAYEKWKENENAKEKNQITLPLSFIQKWIFATRKKIESKKGMMFQMFRHKKVWHINEKRLAEWKFADSPLLCHFDVSGQWRWTITLLSFITIFSVRSVLIIHASISNSILMFHACSIVRTNSVLKTYLEYSNRIELFFVMHFHEKIKRTKTYSKKWSWI